MITSFLKYRNTQLAGINDPVMNESTSLVLSRYFPVYIYLYIMGSLFSSDHKKEKGSKNKGGPSNDGANVRPARKDDQITDKDHAILDLKNSKDRLKKYKKKVFILSFPPKKTYP